MRIVICGGGGLGHTCAGILSNCKGVTVDMLTNHPEKWNHEYRINLPDGSMLTGKTEIISNNPADVIPSADWVFLCVPSYLVEQTLLRIRPHIRPETVIGSVVGYSGFFIYCHKLFPANSRLFSFQRVPYVSRVVDYGKEANLLGFRDKLIMAVENIENREAFRSTVEDLFREKTELADSFYEVTLSNSNPILHTGRIYTMWKEWDGKPFDRCPYFYKEWTLEASLLEIEMDKELFTLLKKLNVSTTHIATLLEHYESNDAQGMTDKLRSIKSLSTLLSPMKQTDGGWVPDLESRFFTEDFPYGLKTLYTLLKENGIPCPNIEKVYLWGKHILNI